MKYWQKDWLEIYCKQNKHLFEEYEFISPRQRFCIELSIKYDEIDKLISKEDSEKLKLIMKYGETDKVDLDRGEIPYINTLTALSYGIMNDTDTGDRVAAFVSQLGGYKKNTPLH